MRRLALVTLNITPLLAVVACSHDAIRYIPETDRSMLQAQDRLGSGGDAAGGPISVNEMLQHAKAGDIAKSASTRVVLRFNGDAVQPDQAQRDTLRNFAAQAGAANLLVSSPPGSFEQPGAQVLGPRRAIAVSHELSEVVPDVQVTFEPSLPPDVVVVSLGSQASPQATP